VPTKAKQHRAREGDPVRKFRSSTRWKKFRAWYLSGDPLCADPFGKHDADGIVVAAQELHHKIPLCERLDLGLVESNVQPLCSECHWRSER